LEKNIQSETNLSTFSEEDYESCLEIKRQKRTFMAEDLIGLEAVGLLIDRET